MQALRSRYPRLTATLPCAALGVHATPVERWTIGDATLLAKRDDLDAPAPAGNKVRALELLLAGLRAGDTLLTVGATGSTHALAVAEHGARIGARTSVVTWPQEPHAIADATAARLAEVADVVHARSVADAYLRATFRRMRAGVRWIPAGGSVPMGAIGHASAAVELADQLARDGAPPPDTIVVPLGSGGTAAGLLVGLAAAGLPTRVIGVRVVPRIIGNRYHVLRLAQRTRLLLARRAGVELPRVDGERLLVYDAAYGGAYARETSASREAAAALRASGGPMLDATYSAKAFAVALARARSAPDERVLFWLTFDARWLAGTGPAADAGFAPLHDSP